MKEINFVCEINNTSYGKVALNVAKNLQKLNIKVNYFPLMGDYRRTEVSEADFPFINEILTNSVTFDGDAPSLRLWHAHDMSFNVGKSKHFGWTIFELDEFSNRELTNLRSLDELIVCSEWAKTICDKYNLKSSVVPLAVNHEIFHPTSETFNECSFVHVGKAELRKQDIILKCFEKAFNKDDCVKLNMVIGNRLLPENEMNEWKKYYGRSSLADKIQVYDWLPSEFHIAKILNNSDCGIFPSHAEGFNFGLLESMACGLQVICTDYSAHKSYCNEENSLLISVDELEVAYDGKWFLGECGSWAKLGKSQEDQLVERMRNIYKRKRAGENLFNEAGVKTAAQFTWKKTVEKLLEIL